MVRSFNPHDFRVGIFGRPNTGKSTLFNRLAGRRLALVDSTPGVTRDRREAAASLAGLEFTVIDTAGLDAVHTFLHSAPSPSQLVNRQPPSPSLQASILEQTRAALRSCDVALFLIDARQPLTEDDRTFARLVRDLHVRWTVDAEGKPVKERLPVVLVANKVEEGTEKDRLEGLEGAYGLGLGEAIEISAEHGEGLALLHNCIDRAFQDRALVQRKEAERSAREVDAADGRERLHFAIVGRPNTGKSTLLNALAGEQRVVTGPQAGITRDAITTALPLTAHEKYRFEVVDTAGIKGGVITRASYNRVDSDAMSASLKAIDLASVVVLVIDVSEGLRTGTSSSPPRARGNEDDVQAALLSRVEGVVHHGDLAIAKRVTDEGRALIIAVNKIDTLDKAERPDVLRGLRLFLNDSLPQVKDVPLIPLSALTALHLHTLLPAIVHTYERWDKRISTARLNAFLHALQVYKPHPSYKGRRVRAKYMAQVGSRPPTFAVWVSGGAGTGKEAVSEEWMRMVSGMLVKEFALEGVVVRVKTRRGEVRNRDQRRADARRRPDAENDEAEDDGVEQSVRRSDLEVRDDDDADDDAVDEGEGEDEDEEGSDDKRRPSRRVARPRFVPFEEDPERQREVALSQIASTVPAAAPGVNPPALSSGFMWPPPLTTISSPSSLAHRLPRSPSQLSFLPLPVPRAPSMSLPWSERVSLQRAKQKRRSEAIVKKKEIAQFVSPAAWSKWKSAEARRHERWVRRDRRILRGREKKAGKGRAGEQSEVDRWAEGRGEKVNSLERAVARSPRHRERQ